MAKVTPKRGPTLPRKFTDTFKKGQTVAIKRTRHGWFDGRLVGQITSISDWSCQVTVTDDELYNGVYDIEKPRDIF